MKLKKDHALSHDLIIALGSTIQGKLGEPEDFSRNGLRKIKLLKDYQATSEVLIEKGSIIFVGEYKGIQLSKKGFGHITFDPGVAIEDHLAKSVKTVKTIKTEE
jgi:hypothetical protein